MVKPEHLHLIPCPNGDIFCPFRMSRIADQPKAWCSRWKANRARDGYHYACDKDFKIVDGR